MGVNLSLYVSLGRAHAHGAFRISRTSRWRLVQFVVVVVVVVAVVVDVVVGVLVLGAFSFFWLVSSVWLCDGRRGGRFRSLTKVWLGRWCGLSTFSFLVAC